MISLHWAGRARAMGRSIIYDIAVCLMEKSGFQPRSILSIAVAEPKSNNIQSQVAIPTSSGYILTEQGRQSETCRFQFCSIRSISQLQKLELHWNLDLGGPLYKEDLGITNDIPVPSNSKLYGGKVKIKRKPRYSEHVLCQSLGPSLYRGSTVSYHMMTGFLNLLI